MVNKTVNKTVNKKYFLVKKKIKFTHKELEIIYNKNCSIFYTENEINIFKNKFKNNID